MGPGGDMQHSETQPPTKVETQRTELESADCGSVDNVSEEATGQQRDKNAPVSA